MSWVTDLVFILPLAHSRAKEYRERFEASFEAAHDMPLFPQDGGGGKVMGSTVYVAGVNWIRSEWIDETIAADWPAGTVLWLQHEGLMDLPDEVVVHQLGPKEAS